MNEKLVHAAGVGAMAWLAVAGGPGASTAQAAIASGQAARDNTLYQSETGALSNGSGSFFFAGNNADGLARRGLIMFDIGSLIPAGSTINSVSLVLHLSQTSSGPQTVSLHRVLSGWGEGDSDAPMGEGGGVAAAPGDATWLHTFFPGSFWSTPGGDFDSIESANAVIDDIGFYFITSAGMTADVQQWLDSPGANFGWLLHGNESIGQTTKRFDSRQSTTLEFRPVLTIDYTPIPAPGAVLALVALAYRRRRR